MSTASVSLTLFCRPKGGICTPLHYSLRKQEKERHYLNLVRAAETWDLGRLAPGLDTFPSVSISKSYFFLSSAFHIFIKSSRGNWPLKKVERRDKSSLLRNYPIYQEKPLLHKYIVLYYWNIGPHAQLRGSIPVCSSP